VDRSLDVLRGLDDGGFDNPWVEELANVLGDLVGRLLTTDARKIITRNLASWDTYSYDKFGRAMRNLGWVKRELRTDSDRGRAYFYTKGPSPWPRLTVTVELDSSVSVRAEKS